MRNKAQLRVWIIVDKLFGEQLAELPQDDAVWIIASDVNTPFVNLLWQKDLPTYHPNLTVFKAIETDTPEEALLAILFTVDEHHGYASFEIPYRELQVVGCLPSPEIHLFLDDLELKLTKQTAIGFVACRTHES